MGSVSIQKAQPSLLALKQALKDNNAEKIFPIGTIIPSTWSDLELECVYKTPFIVVDYRKVQVSSKSKRFAAILLHQYALPFQLRYGDAHLTQSTLLKWANSDQYVDLAERVGFLTGCSKDLLKIITPIIIEPDVESDPGAILAKFFPPSLDEMSLEIDDGNHQPPWQYFQPSAKSQRRTSKRWEITDTSNHECECWLRSTRRGDRKHIWTTINGCATLHNVNTLNSCILACAITD